MWRVSFRYVAILGIFDKWKFSQRNSSLIYQWHIHATFSLYVISDIVTNSIFIKFLQWRNNFTTCVIPYLALGSKNNFIHFANTRPLTKKKLSQRTQIHSFKSRPFLFSIFMLVDIKLLSITSLIVNSIPASILFYFDDREGYGPSRKQELWSH